jgi:hypothetical protein
MSWGLTLNSKYLLIFIVPSKPKAIPPLAPGSALMILSSAKNLGCFDPVR